MLSSVTISILKRLSLAELKRCGDFVKSPYHNTTSSLEIIYDAVLKSYPDFNSKTLSYENMAKKIFPDGENKEKRIKNLYSEFGNLLRKFLGYEEMFTFKEYELDVFIAEGLSRKSLFDESEKFIKKSTAQNDNGFITNDFKYFYKLRMDTLRKHNFLTSSEWDSEDLKEISRIHSESIIVGLLKSTYSDSFAYSMNDRLLSPEFKLVMNDAFIDSLDMNKFLEKLKETENKYYSYLKVNFLLYYYTIHDITEETYYDLKNEILKTIHTVEKWEAYSFITRTNGIIVANLSKVKKDYSLEVFDFAKLFCKMKFFPGDVRVFLEIGDFYDMFITAMNLKEYEWAENFANEYVPYLNKEHQSNQFNYIKSIFSFKRGNYEESLNYLRNISDDYIMMKLDIRFYYIMNFIELKAYESAIAALHAFKQFYKDNGEIHQHAYKFIPDSLRFFDAIIKCEEMGTKIDDFVLNEANDGRKFYHMTYIRNKMEKLK